jgi:GNAT superfamily N-acetyltransferase
MNPIHFVETEGKVMMTEGTYPLLTNFEHDPARRKAFNDLAGIVFGLDFEPWYQQGHWNEQYAPFTFFDGETAVSNVSANRLTLVLDGVRKKAIQFGTVMTHPEYRNRGLARKLMMEAIGSLRDECSLFYLMAGKDALGFYLKLGFKALAESTYTLHLAAVGSFSCGAGRYLSFDRQEDGKVLLKAAALRNPVSEKVGVLDSQHLLAFYALNGFGDKCYWIRRGAGGDPLPPEELSVNHDAVPFLEYQDNDLLVLFHEEGETLHLHDVLSCQPVAVHQLLSWLPHGMVRKVSFGFTPDLMGISPSDGILEVTPLVGDDTFLIMPPGVFAEPPFLYPPIGLA